MINRAPAQASGGIPCSRRSSSRPGGRGGVAAAGVAGSTFNTCALGRGGCRTGFPGRVVLPMAARTLHAKTPSGAIIGRPRTMRDREGRDRRRSATRSDQALRWGRRRDAEKLRLQWPASRHRRRTRVDPGQLNRKEKLVRLECAMLSRAWQALGDNLYLENKTLRKSAC